MFYLSKSKSRDTAVRRRRQKQSYLEAAIGEGGQDVAAREGGRETNPVRDKHPFLRGPPANLLRSLPYWPRWDQLWRRRGRKMRLLSPKNMILKGTL